MKKLIAITLSVLLLASFFTVAVSAESSKVSIRIEGIEKNFFNGEIEISDGATVADALTALDKNNDTITIKGIADNFITEVNGEKSATFGGYDGWNYSVNGSAPSVGVCDYKLSSGDVVVLYYGDYPCQIPVVDLSKASEGIITISSYDTSWIQDDKGDWISSSEWVPVTGATVTLTDNNKSQKYVTDKNGVINFTVNDFSGTVKADVDKKSASGAPAVCRESFSFELENTNPSVTETTEPTATEKTKVTVALAKNEIYVSGTTKVNTNVVNPKGKTSYTSNKKSVAVVNKNGKVTAKKKGVATITVKNNGVKAKVKITVKNPKLNKSKINLKKGKSFKIKITGKAGKQTYTSSKKSVAKVSKKGKVTAKKRGKAVITVKTNKSVKLKLKVKVK